MDEARRAIKKSASSLPSLEEASSLSPVNLLSSKGPQKRKRASLELYRKNATNCKKIKHSTISRDCTADDHTRQSVSLAYLGHKLKSHHTSRTQRSKKGELYTRTDDETQLQLNKKQERVNDNKINEIRKDPYEIQSDEDEVHAGRSPHGETRFAKACAKGEYEKAKKRLAERPEDLNSTDFAGNTPLQVACLNGQEDIVQLLIEAGCNLNSYNCDRETPLLDAVENGHLAVVKLLLKAGVKSGTEGRELLKMVPDDLDNAEEIRAALRQARERVS
ncbi:ankyrin repeat-containing domain protein [Xylaria arbuscula]|nr:ankyrin repeat-containing domain protein [Xylaria arbuscula]